MQLGKDEPLNKLSGFFFGMVILFVSENCNIIHHGIAKSSPNNSLQPHALHSEYQEVVSVIGMLENNNQIDTRYKLLTISSQFEILSAEQ
jgi:hypothetical protein